MMSTQTLYREASPTRSQRNNASGILYAGIWCLFFLIYARPQDIIVPLQFIRPVVLLTGVLLIAVLVSKKGNGWYVRSPFLGALLALNVTMAVSIPFSYYDGLSFWSTVKFGMVLLTGYLIIRIVDSFERIEKIIILISTVMVIFSVDIARQYLAGASHRDIHGLVGGQFANPNDLSVSLVLFMPMLYYFFLVAKNSIVKLGALGSMGLLLFAIVGCQSRGGMLGAGIVLGLLLLKTKKKAIALFVGILILPIVLISLPQDAFDRLETLSNYEEDGSAMTRLWFWESSVKMLLHRPITGVGMKAWSTAYAQDYRNPLDETNRWPDPHSTYFQIMAELGLPGVIAYGTLLYFTFRSLGRLERATKNRVEFRRQLYFIQCLRIGVIGFLFCTIFQSFSYANNFYILMALVAAMEMIILGADQVEERNIKPRYVYGKTAETPVYHR